MTDTTAPRLGLPAMDVSKANDDDIRFHSVTSIIGVLDKPALIWWAANETAKASVLTANSLVARIKEDGADEVEKWLTGARFRRPKNKLTAANLGSAFHAAAELYALEGVRPDDELLTKLVKQQGGGNFTGVEGEVATLRLMLDQFDRWLQLATPEYIATEVCVLSPTYGYAGTADGFFIVDGQRLLLDYKTSRDQFTKAGKQKGPYPEVALQLAMYRFAEIAALWRPRRTEIFRKRYYLASPAEIAQGVPVPEVDGGVVIHVTPGSCEAYPVRCDETIFQSALFVLEAARYQKDIAKNVIGEPLVFEEAA